MIEDAQSVTSLLRAKDLRYGLLQLPSRIRLQEPSLFKQVSQMQADPHVHSINARLILHRASPEKKDYLPKLLLSPMYAPLLAPK